MTLLERSANSLLVFDWDLPFGDPSTAVQTNAVAKSFIVNRYACRVSQF